MFLFDDNTAKISQIIAKNGFSDKEFLEKEIAAWKISETRRMQIKGRLYYDNQHDILFRKREAIGENGELTEITNLPNNRVVDNVYGKLVNQKANYLLGQPFALDGENKQYIDLLKTVFDKKFMRTLKNAGKAALNGGISWLYPFYDDNGKFSFRMFPAEEILPFWQDSEHTVLDCAVRLYCVSVYEGSQQKIIEKVEVYSLDGVKKFILDGGVLKPDADENGSFVSSAVSVPDGQGGVVGYNWSKIPLIPIKYNESETPLLKRVKTLQDGLNVMMSDFENNMQEDARNTILVLKNFDGENLGEFRRNLATYGAVKVRCDGETNGGVDKLEVQVNSDNYKAIIDLLKKSIIENGMGYDAKDERLSGNPNQMNIQSMYSDIDLDANDMETELQAAFDDILWFVNAHLANSGYGDFSGETVNVIFNRDILINETEAIQNCAASVGLLSGETIVSQHPWVDDPQAELKRIQAEKEAEAQAYDPFGGVMNDEEQ